MTGNNKVWKKFTFTPITTTKIRVLTSSSADAYSRITEVEAWGNEAPAARTNFALGGTTSASSQISANYPAFSTINGDRRGLNWNFGGGWNDATVNTHPDWLQIDFNNSKTIDEIDVFTLQDTPASPAEPTESMTFTLYGLTGYSVQYWNGSTWVTVTGGTVTGNNKVWRKFTFTAITTTKIRVLTSSSPDAYSRLTEVEAWGPMEPVASAAIKWLVADQLGTPRMTFDQSGDLANITRHDYLPFGEELFAPSGGRTTAMGYTNSDEVRQQFTSKERDVETGLDYFLARYYSSNQGRFTSIDPLLASGAPAHPQSWNRYCYTINNPLKYIDPKGMRSELVQESGITDDEEQSRRQQPQQPPSRVVLIVGDPGIGTHNVGRNFERAAETRRGELERAGSEVIVNRASTVQDFNAALNNNGTLTGVEYFGHAGPGALFIGENPGANTNLDSTNVAELSGKNLAPDATVTLTGCNTAVDVTGNDSIGRQVANQLQRTTVGYSGELEFSTNRRAPAGETRHPDRGPTYMVPSSRNVRPVGFTPVIPVRPPY